MFTLGFNAFKSNGSHPAFLLAADDHLVEKFQIPAVDGEDDHPHAKDHFLHFGLEIHSLRLDQEFQLQ